VDQVLGDHLPQVVLVDDQHPVEQLAAQGADHPLADSVRPGCLRRAGENPGARCREHGVEGGSQLPGAIPDQELDRSRAVAEIHQEAARCLRCPRALGVRGDAGQVGAAGAVLDDDQGVDAAQQHGVYVHEVDGEDAAGCTVRNCFQVGPVRRGAGSMPASCRICQTVDAAIRWPS
jgi:hypothetical protein